MRRRDGGRRLASCDLISPSLPLPLALLRSWCSSYFNLGNISFHSNPARHLALFFSTSSRTSPLGQIRTQLADLSLPSLPPPSPLSLSSAVTFLLAPLPNSICSRCAGADDYAPEYNSFVLSSCPSPPHPDLLLLFHLPPCFLILKPTSFVSFVFLRGYLDFGHFLTSIIVVSAFSLPLILAHTELIAPAACWMSMSGGALVYGTILVFSGVFVSALFLSSF